MTSKNKTIIYDVNGRVHIGAKKLKDGKKTIHRIEICLAFADVLMATTELIQEKSEPICIPNFLFFKLINTKEEYVATNIQVQFCSKLPLFEQCAFKFTGVIKPTEKVTGTMSAYSRDRKIEGYISLPLIVKVSKG